MKKILSGSLIQGVALVLALGGLAGSLKMVLDTGKNNPSTLLVTLFLVWVASPFIAIFTALWVSRRWPFGVMAWLYFLILVIVAGSLAFYSGWLEVTGTKPAFKFLVIPPVSWLLIAVFFEVARRQSRKHPENIINK